MTELRQLPLELPHRPSFDRADLIETDANRLAIHAVDSWPQWPHPVLAIVGPPGSGKTHLAEAWAASSGAQRPQRGKSFDLTPGFACVIDDLDRKKPQEETLFGIVNAARMGLGTVLVTSRKPLSSLRFRLPDLRSRLRAATIVSLQAPDDALLEGVFVKLFSDRQIEVDPRMFAFILSRMERSVVAAEQLVDALDRESLATGRKVTRAMVSRQLSVPSISR
ncbi:hypothetical protein FPY71_06790 [Aureimonas fodinaquatilis]|uniref:AAA+ ATPase domain-containing protein n=1 Tax=Aureimonas fodinaquatilis TaxID=2565783 RepID=A0A5B0DTZ6_9HYPH|nr:hypothetical protein [Aureimonas fodinaquatilis]KAA0970234.1 hypothetical protein FPY71_06790 [Aureimonas fodinaquatilis]